MLATIVHTFFRIAGMEESIFGKKEETSATPAAPAELKITLSQ